MNTQVYKYIKAIELYTINEWIIWYVNYISIKLFIYNIYTLYIYTHYTHTHTHTTICIEWSVSSRHPTGKRSQGRQYWWKEGQKKGWSVGHPSLWCSWGTMGSWQWAVDVFSVMMPQEGRGWGRHTWFFRPFVPGQCSLFSCSPFDLWLALQLYCKMFWF